MLRARSIGIVAKGGRGRFDEHAGGEGDRPSRSRLVGRMCVSSFRRADTFGAKARACRLVGAGHAARMIVVHHLNNSRSQRILWLLEELGVPYEVKRYERDRKTMLAPPELEKVHPLGKSPVVEDGEAKLAESGAIIDYLARKYADGKLVPKASAEELRYTYWLHYAEGSAMPPLLLKLVLDTVQKAPAPFFVKPIVNGIVQKVTAGFVGPQLTTHLGFIEAELAKAPWFAGTEFSAADIQMSFPLEAATARGGITKATHPYLFAFLEKIHARPGYRAALAKGGPYALG
jgi:glutathione S-transferase